MQSPLNEHGVRREVLRMFDAEVRRAREAVRYAQVAVFAARNGEIGAVPQDESWARYRKRLIGQRVGLVTKARHRVETLLALRRIYVAQIAAQRRRA